MERFGRSRLLDRWGGGFIVAAVLGLVVAWIIAARLLPSTDPIADKAQDQNQVATQPQGSDLTSFAAAPTMAAKAYSLDLVQVTVSSSPEQVQKLQQKLQTKGFAASATKTAPFHVYAGAYSTPEAARAAQGLLQKSGFDKLYVKKVNVLPPAQIPKDHVTEFQQTVTALGTYLYDAALFFDNQVAQHRVGADKVVADAKAVQAMAAKLQGAKDPMAGDLSGLVTLAGSNAGQIANLAKTNRPEDGRQAMQDFLNLLRDYQDWAAGH